MRNQKQDHTKLQDTEKEWWLPEAGVEGGGNRCVGQKVQTSSHKINKSWGRNVPMVTVVNNTALYI